MKKMMLLDNAHSKNCRNFLIRLGTAIIASHFIVVHSSKKSWISLWYSYGYYKSLIGSAIIAYVLVEMVYRITKMLNRRQNGFDFTKQRLWQQLLYGVGITGIIEVFMAASLYAIFNRNILKSDYFTKLYPFILLFIFCINLVYCLYYDTKRLSKQITRFRILKENQNALSDCHTTAPETSQPAIIYLKEGQYFAINFDGEWGIWPHNIKQSEDFLDAYQYFKSARNCIINRKAILKIEARGNRVKIVPSFEFKDELLTSRSKTAPFKLWLTQRVLHTFGEVAASIET